MNKQPWSKTTPFAHHHCFSCTTQHQKFLSVFDMWC